MVRPMRSWMFVPGDKQRYLDKAAASEVDCAILDLEDGVLPSDKTAARALVARTLGRADFAPLRFVRVNAVGTPWFEDDLDAVLIPGVDGVCLPKADDADLVRAVATRVRRAEKAHALPTGSIGIVAAIESAAALVRAAEIAACTPQLVGLMFGAEDYALDLGITARREREAADLVYARSAVVVAAAAAKLLSIDGVHPDLDDSAGMTADAVRARGLGFTSKSTFNPRQVAEINRVFSPQPEEIEYARRVVGEFEDAGRRGNASVVVGGQLVDLPIVRRAQRVLALVEQARS